MSVSCQNEMVTARVQDLVLANSVAVEALVEMLEERGMVTRDDVRYRVRSICRGRNRIRRGARVFEDLARVNGLTEPTLVQIRLLSM